MRHSWRFAGHETTGSVVLGLQLQLPIESQALRTILIKLHGAALPATSA